MGRKVLQITSIRFTEVGVNKNTMNDRHKI